MTPASLRQIHVRFASELTVPPADRQRKGRALYPKVAQEKGRSKRQSSFDLFWKWETLTSVSRQVKAKCHIKNPVAEKSQTESLEYTTLLRVSGEVPPHIRWRRFFLGQAFGLLVSHTPPAKHRDTEPLDYKVLECSRKGADDAAGDRKSATIHGSTPAEKQSVEGW